MMPICSKGSIKITGDVILNADFLEKFINSNITVGGKFTFNGSGILTNSGEITINSSDENNALLINASSIINTTEGIINVPNGGLLQKNFNRMVDGNRTK